MTESEPRDKPRPSLWRGALAGLAAGLVASAAMDLFQRGLARLSDSDSDGEPATEQVADRISEAVAGAPLHDASKPLGGEAVHYAFGALLGAGYGVIAEVWPAATTGAGSAFGMVTATVFDEAAVPAAGLGPTPWETPASSHAYSYASHLVFALASEATRAFTRTLLESSQER